MPTIKKLKISNLKTFKLNSYIYHPEIGITKQKSHPEIGMAFDN